MRSRVILAAAVTCLGAFLLWGELVSARASVRGVEPGRVGARRTVLLLGYGNRGARANAVNRYRVRAALRTLRGTSDVLIASGGTVHSAVAESRILAAYAKTRGYRGRILLETQSRSTEENILRCIPLLDDAEAIAIVSNSLHAERARGLLRAHRPDLALRLIRADEYRFGEIPVIKAVSAALDLLARCRARSAAR